MCLSHLCEHGYQWSLPLSGRSSPLREERSGAMRCVALSFPGLLGNGGMEGNGGQGLAQGTPHYGIRTVHMDTVLLTLQAVLFTCCHNLLLRFCSWFLYFYSYTFSVDILLILFQSQSLRYVLLIFWRRRKNEGERTSICCLLYAPDWESSPTGNQARALTGNGTRDSQ